MRVGGSLLLVVGSLALGACGKPSLLASCQRFIYTLCKRNFECGPTSAAASYGDIVGCQRSYEGTCEQYVSSKCEDLTRYDQCTNDLSAAPCLDGAAGIPATCAMQSPFAQTCH